MQVIFEYARPETATVTSYFFKPTSEFTYTAGQFVELTVPHSASDSRGPRRWFTLSSAPSDKLLSITTRHDQEQSSSFKRALAEVTPGRLLQMSDPMGDFVLPKFLQTPLVFVAAGLGVTPFHSMLRWLTATHEERPIQFIYAVKHEEEIIFQQTFEDARQHVTIVVSQPSAAWGGEHATLSADLVLGLSQPTDEALIYLAGPETVLDKLSRDFQHSGVAKRQLVIDAFPGYKDL